MSKSNVIEIWNLNRYPCHFESGNWDYHLYDYDLYHLLEWSSVHDDCNTKAGISLLLTQSLNIYGWLMRACLECNVEKVLDIGCGHGQQSLMFKSSGIEYAGLEKNRKTPFYGDEFGIECIRGTWPDDAPRDFDAAISSHCVGTGCIWEAEKIHEMYPVFAGNCQVKFFDELFELYKHRKIIGYEKESVAAENTGGSLNPMMLAVCWN